MIFLSIHFSELSAQKISIKNGGLVGDRFYQEDQLISKKDLSFLMAENQVAFNHWKKYRTYKDVGIIAGGVAMGTSIWFFSSFWKRAVIPFDNSNVHAPFAWSLGSCSVLITCRIISSTQRNKAVLIYNNGIDSRSSIMIVPASNGIGIALRF
jgi:hypothetical protein